MANIDLLTYLLRATSCPNLVFIAFMKADIKYSRDHMGIASAVSANFP